MQNAICQPQENRFHTRNMRKCEKYVLTIQRRLDKAVANHDKPKIRWYLHLLTKRSRAVKVIATSKITKVNEGRYTAGVDQVAIPREKEEQDAVRLRLYQEIEITRKPRAIRRVFIPKPNGKLRPLGIPTLKDRINQEMIRLAIEPICEYHFHPSSHGFRPKRSCQDAMSELFLKLSHQTSRQWIIEGDIKGCFDHINHEQITRTLKTWHITEGIVESINQMLKAKIVFGDQIFDNDTGTPQGGVISPILANVALTTLDEYCLQFGRKFNGKIVSPIVRYADDFVIVCENEQEAKTIKEKVAKHLKEKVGLELSNEKTKITHISKGFNFLSFNFRKYKNNGKEVLLIKPQSEKVRGLRHKLKKILKECKDSTQEVVIERLNPIITGWGMYYRHVVSKETFRKLDYDIWYKLYRWSRKTTGKHFRKKLGIERLTSIPIKRFIKVNSNYRVYDVKAKDYWEQREYQNAKDSILGNGVLTKLFGRQKGQCAYCKQPITKEEINNREFHKHHMKPHSEGGDEKLSNLRLLHKSCHQELHEIVTRKQMSESVDNGIDYLRLLKKKTS